MNTSEKDKCQRCGAEIRGESTERLCPACLMSGALKPPDGKAELIKTTASNGNETFNPPGDAVRKNDWLLVIDDAGKEWGAPGTVSTH